MAPRDVIWHPGVTPFQHKLLFDLIIVQLNGKVETIEHKKLGGDVFFQFEQFYSLIFKKFSQSRPLQVKLNFFAKSSVDI